MAVHKHIHHTTSISFAMLSSNCQTRSSSPGAKFLSSEMTPSYWMTRPTEGCVTTRQFQDRQTNTGPKRVHTFDLEHIGALVILLLQLQRVALQKLVHVLLWRSHPLCKHKEVVMKDMGLRKASRYSRPPMSTQTSPTPGTNLASQPLGGLRGEKTTNQLSLSVRPPTRSRASSTTTDRFACLRTRAAYRSLKSARCVAGELSLTRLQPRASSSHNDHIHDLRSGPHHGGFAAPPLHVCI
jgi:hypothetical protein